MCYVVIWRLWVRIPVSSYLGCRVVLSRTLSNFITIKEKRCCLERNRLTHSYRHYSRTIKTGQKMNFNRQFYLCVECIQGNIIICEDVSLLVRVSQGHDVACMIWRSWVRIPVRSNLGCVVVLSLT